MNYDEILPKICAFIKNKVEQAEASGVVLGLSGGVDSAVVATLCKKALNDKVFVLLMPAKNSNQANLKDALNLCKSLNLSYKIIEIQSFLDAFLSCANEADKFRIGNFAARIRMSLLYDASAERKSLVIGTSNKSEIMLGYGTIYGDIACAFNPIGNLYKSQIYELAAHLKLDENFIKKPASADLWEGQEDEKELGYTYALLDEGLRALENGKNLEKFKPEFLDFLREKIKKNEFKRVLPEIFKF